MSSQAGVAMTAGSRDAAAAREREPFDQAVAPSTVLSSDRRWRLSRAAAIALLLGLVVTAALAVTSLVLYNRNEDRLLTLRVRELGLVLTAAVPSIQTPLASAAELADATNGNAQKFRAFMAPYVGSGRQFASASLWPLGPAHPAPTVVVGPAPALASQPEEARQFFARAIRTQLLNVTAVSAAAGPGLGYEFSTPGAKHGYAAYAETLLPKDRRSRLESNTAFSDLNYALYLGRSRRSSNLLVSSVRRLPIKGRQASDVVPFGNNEFTLVVTPNEPLGGGFFANLPWIIAIFGVLLAVAAALMTDRLARRRQQAEHLADVLNRVASENRQMYAEQRSIAQTLQHALLPETLPELDGLRVGARYVPATSGIDVGGDWYDVVAADDRHVLLVIGDVSGHGLRAATTMAALRHAALAYAAQDWDPATVLAKLSHFVNSGVHDYFATVLCALIDVDAHRLTVASAGHLPPLLIDRDGAAFVTFEVDVAIGVTRDVQYHQTTVSVPQHATLIAFTDGLVERRGEALDVGLERLRDTAVERQLGLEDLLSKITRDLATEDHRDDTAIVGLQWQA